MLTAELIVDCGPKVGLGHLRRCLVLAHALDAASVDCRFAITDASCCDLVKGEGFNVRVVDRRNPELHKATILIVDGYHYGLEFSKALKNICACRVFLDDMGDRPVESEIILNPNLYGPKIDYHSYWVDEILCGHEYNLVSNAFFMVARNVSSHQSSDCLVSFGATDDGRYAGTVVRNLLVKTNLSLKVVLSPLLPIVSEMREIAATSSGRVELHHGGNLNELMATSQLYVGAAGSGALEALAFGLRIVVASIIDNQRYNAQAFRDLGEKSFDDFDPEKIAAAVTTFTATPVGTVVPILSESGGSRIADKIIGWINVRLEGVSS